MTANGCPSYSCRRLAAGTRTDTDHFWRGDMGSDGAPGGFHRTAAGQDAGSPAGLAPADKEALAELEFHWGSAYRISRDENGTWGAARRDRLGRQFTAPDAEGLGKMIRDDYAANPVPRNFQVGDAS